MIVRRNRLIIRVSLILVLCAGMFGGWYASRNWMPDLEAYEGRVLSEDVDLIELAAGIGEEAVQLFLGLTSGE